MSKQELFKQFLTDRLSAVALEIFGAFEQTIVDFQIEIHRSIEENARLQQRLLNVAKQPEKITLHRADVNQPTLPEIKDERELWTNQAKDSSQLLLIYETPTVENSGDSVPINRTDQIKAEPDGEDYGAPVRDSQSPSIVSPDCRTAQRLRENRRGRYTPTQEVAPGRSGMRPCLFCPKVVVAYSQHLRVTHHVRNAKERVILCKWQSGRVNIRQQACPVAECTTHARNLQRHIMESHTELTVVQRRRVLDEVKRRLTIERLTMLRATVPLIPLVTDWDLKEAARQEDELFKETSSSTPPLTPHRQERKSSGAARDVQQPSLTERQIKEEQELWTTQGEDSSQIVLLCHTPTVENSGGILPIKTTDQIKAESDGALEPANESPSPSVVCPDGSTAQSLEEERVGLLPELKPRKSNGTKTEKMNIM